MPGTRAHHIHMNSPVPSFCLRTLLAGASGLLAAVSPALAQNAPPVSPPRAASADVVTLEELHIISSPLGSTTGDFAQSATVLADEAFRLRQQPTLGETLEGLPGVASTYFGPGASRPIIRGLGEERIRVLRDGLGTIDASAASPDHAVSAEPGLSERIEVLRGPATLLYGSSAVGGVVNIVGEHVPVDRRDVPLSGAVEARFDSVSQGKTGLAEFQGGDDTFGWQVSGLRRSAGDVDIPGLAEHAHDDEAPEEGEEEPVRGTLPNSALSTTAGSVGGTWFWSRGSVGIGYSRLETRYGVPGHEHHDEEGEEPAGEEHGGGVRIDLEQDRWELRTEVKEPFAMVRSARLTAAVADYTHRELEGDELGTRFDTRGGEARLELLHEPIGGLEGVVGVQYLNTREEAEGEEAFLPPTRTTGAALFALEEIEAGDIRWQVGARLETQDIDVRDGSGRTQDGTAFSISAGGVWTVAEPWTLAFSVARSARQPTAQELFADGPHAATASYSIGDPGLGRETSTGVDLALRRRSGAITGSVSLFLNDFQDFIFETPTDEEQDELPVFRYAARDARFYGAEAEITWHAHDEQGRGVDVYGLVDTVRGTNESDNTPLPRLPPWRLGLGAVARHGAWSAGVDVRYAFDQDRVAPFEEETDGYTLVSAHLGYTVPLERGSLYLFLRGTNLGDTEARPHTSFLKEVAPLPGRNFTAGARWEF